MTPRPTLCARWRRRRLACLPAALCLFLLAAQGRAQTSDEPAAGEPDQEPPARWSLGLRLVSWGTARDPGNSPLAAFESLTGSRREVRSELRADAALDLGELHLGARPRLALAGREWAQRPAGDDEETVGEAYLNAGEIVWDAHERLQVSLERSAPDWGPSAIFSASNPLGRRNARLNPKEELPGADFVTARWFPEDAWTVSLLATIGAGRTGGAQFQRGAVLKIDAAGGEAFASLVLSRAEDGPTRVGAYLTGSPTAGLLLYAEASAGQRDAEAIAGLTYTLDAGPTLAAEYFFNESGSPDGDAALAAARQTANTRDLFLRRNYLLLQLADSDARQAGDALLRVLYCLDDGSTALVGYLEKGIGGHLRAFLFGMRTFGGGDDEFPAVLRSALTAGLEVAF